MKLEVGKKYVDDNGGIVKIVDTKGLWFLGYNISKISDDNYKGEGLYFNSYDNNGEVNEQYGDVNLVSEYIEPRTKDALVVLYDNDGSDVFVVYSDGVAALTEDSWVKVSSKKLTLTEGQYDV